MSRILTTCLIVAWLVLVPRAGSAQPADPPPPGRWEVLAGGRADPLRFDQPSHLAVDGRGNVYLADYNNHRVVKLPAGGGPTVAWGTYGSAPGAFASPHGLALDADGNVYVTEWTENHRIQKFSPRGELLAYWSVEPGPTSVAVDQSGNLFVTGGNQVRKLSPNGEEVAVWGSLRGNSAPGEFDAPWGVTLDSEGNVYVADTRNDRIQKLSPAGEPLAQWTGLFTFSVAVDPEGNVYAPDFRGRGVAKLGPSGERLATFVAPTVGTASSQSARGVTLDAQGNLYVSYWSENLVRKFAPDGSVLAVWGIPRPEELAAVGHLERPVGVATAANGEVFVADSGTGHVHRFAASGAPISRWGPAGPPGGGIVRTSGGQFDGLRGIAVGPDGMVYLALRGSRSSDVARVERRTPDGQLLATWDRRPYQPQGGLAVDADGFVYMLADLNRMVKLDAEGQVVRVWGTRGNDERLLLNSPVGIAIDSSRTVYVTNRGTGLVLRYSVEGQPLGPINGPEEGGRFSFPTGLAVDGQGNLYVAESFSHQVRVVSSEGSLLAEWGERGNTPGQFDQPVAIAVDPRGTIYVVDSGNQRVQKLVR